ncbi:response regulator transcription factor [Paenibacillus sp. FA6]|uniref:response regulator transcription factor n=1 Tax=Paenibacillus sp. FA6 TaxID=3413029 RepID=UPI003F65EC9B
MTKVMLIDDDVPVVEYLLKLVPWEQLEISVCAMAYSAEEAQKLFYATQPDILVTDIGLPDGNGIELARHFRISNPGLRVVFLTCHEDFHFLKEALSIEADDYIVKAELSPHKMIESIRKAQTRINSVQMELERIAYKSDVERNKDILTQQFFDDLLHAADPEAWLIQGERLGIEWNQPCFSTVLCHLDLGRLFEVYDRVNLDLVRYAAYNIASELAEGTSIIPIMSRDTRLWLIANTSNAEVARREFADYLSRLRGKLDKFLKIECYFTVDDSAGPLTQLKTTIYGIKEEISLQYYDSYWLVKVGYSQQSNARTEGEMDTRTIEEYAEKWTVALCDFNRSLVHMYLGTIEKLMGELRLKPSKAQDLLIRLLQQAAFKLGRQMDELLQQDIRQTIRIGEAFRIVRWFTDRLLEQTKSAYEENYTSNPDLRDINAYVYENIHKTITSIDIARYLHLNPSYFSRLFKKMAGLNFTDHVHLLKMEEAKQLLAPNNETAENVAYMLGYSDRAYFSKVFKKYIGMSPSEFKQRQKDIDGEAR